MSKQQEVASFIRKISRQAVGDMMLYANEEQIKFLRANHEWVTRSVSDQIMDDYRFAELADIMEWKKTRVRR